jgi:hypothetical protein
MKGGIEERAALILSKRPHLVADVRLYPTNEGGARLPKSPGWGCLCCDSKSSFITHGDGKSYRFGHDGWPQLEKPLAPGDQRRLGFVFLFSGEEAVELFRKTGVFYLWEGKFIGEAVIVKDTP